MRRDHVVEFHLLLRAVIHQVNSGIKPAELHAVVVPHVPVPFLRIFADEIIALAAVAIHAARFRFGIRAEPGQLGRAERAHFRISQRRHH